MQDEGAHRTARLLAEVALLQQLQSSLFAQLVRRTPMISRILRPTWS